MMEISERTLYLPLSQFVLYLQRERPKALAFEDNQGDRVFTFYFVTEEFSPVW